VAEKYIISEKIDEETAGIAGMEAVKIHIIYLPADIGCR
jgi:hypothetical protein